jgi:hypothetical protein
MPKLAIQQSVTPPSFSKKLLPLIMQNIESFLRELFKVFLKDHFTYIILQLIFIFNITLLLFSSYSFNLAKIELYWS